MGENVANKDVQIYVIADYGKGDPAFAEVYQFVSNLLPHADIKEVHVDPLNTTNTGFWINQLALNHAKLQASGDLTKKTYFYVNTAPRRDNKDARRNNEGEGLVYAKLKTGLEIVGVFADDVFSLVKPLIEELRVIDIRRDGDQFRSRDIFPYALKDIVNGNYSILGKKMDISSIQDPESGIIAHVDGYGNIKTTYMPSDLGHLTPGDEVKVVARDLDLCAAYVGGIFGVKEGQLCVAPGSSGEKGNRFIELSVRHGSAAAALGHPKPGETLLVENLVPKKAALRS